MPFHGTKKPRAGSQKRSSRVEETESEIGDQDELQDVVYDFERGQMLLDRVDGFLSGKDPIEQFSCPAFIRLQRSVRDGHRGGGRKQNGCYELLFDAET